MPGPIALQQECCQPECDEVQSIQVPGPAGAAGAAGVAGAAGAAAFTTLTAQFLMPAEGATVNAAVGSTAWMTVGQALAVQVAGTMIVSSITNSVTAVLQNPENTASGLYPANAAATTPIPAGSKISPSGVQGPAGTLTGAAGGDLKGTFPNPTLSKANTKGTLIVGDGTNAQNLSVGADGTVLHARSAQALGQQWSGIDMGGINTALTGTLPIARGGTSGATAQLAINALGALTARGDLLVRNAAGNTVPLPIGAAGTVLKSATDPVWALINSGNIDPTYLLMTRQGLIAEGTINLNAAPGTDVVVGTLSSRYIIRRVVIENASTNLAVSAARIGVYTNAAAGGTAIVTTPNSELTALTTANIYDDLTLAAPVAFTVFTDVFLYLYLGVAHGSAATLRVRIFGDNVQT